MLKKYLTGKYLRETINSLKNAKDIFETKIYKGKLDGIPDLGRRRRFRVKEITGHWKSKATIGRDGEKVIFAGQVKGAVVGH